MRAKTGLAAMADRIDDTSRDLLATFWRVMFAARGLDEEQLLALGRQAQHHARAIAAKTAALRDADGADLTPHSLPRKG